MDMKEMRPILRVAAGLMAQELGMTSDGVMEKCTMRELDLFCAFFEMPDVEANENEALAKVFGATTEEDMVP